MNVCYEFIFYLAAMDVRFKTPANFYICGQTQSGKSYFVRRMLNDLEESSIQNSLLLWGVSKRIC